MHLKYMQINSSSRVLMKVFGSNHTFLKLTPITNKLNAIKHMVINKLLSGELFNK